MSDTHDDHDADPAALEELLRAFGVDDEPAVDDGDATAATGDPIVIHIVEQDPVTDVEPQVDEPGAPTIVRIDDFSGTTVEVRDDVVNPDMPPDAPVVVGHDDGSGHATPDPVDTAEPDVEHVDGDHPLPDAEHVAGNHPLPDAGAETVAPVVIAIGGDEELPDPLYVEGNLERSGTRSIVFIEDDDTGDSFKPESEREVRRGIEPRLRERRAAVKRAIGRKRLRWIVIGVSVVVIGVGTLAVLGSGLFAIRAENVEVIGAVYTDDALLDEVIDDLVGTPILLVDTQAAEQRLEEIPWIDQARVRTSFPSSAVIDIREREAMATYQGLDQRYRVLDREGRVLDVLDGWPIAYVLLMGPDPVDLAPGDFAPRGYAAASELAKNLTGSVRSDVSFIEVAADGSRLSLHLDDGTVVRFGAARDLFAKLVRLETVLAADPDREPGPIDVSTREVIL